MVTLDYFVLFADMLGFKRLVMAHKVPLVRHLDFRGRAVGRTVGALLNWGNPLGDAFTAFHGGIETTINKFTWSEQIALIVFSDSLFLASTSAKDFEGDLRESFWARSDNRQAYRPRSRCAHPLCAHGASLSVPRVLAWQRQMPAPRRSRM